MEITQKEIQELDRLMLLQQSNNPMTQEQFDRLSFLKKKLYHNSCLNPHCSGYVGKEEQSHCKHCGQELFKMNSVH